MVTIVGIVSRRGLIIEVCHRNQPNKSKLVLCKPRIHFNSRLKQLYVLYITRQSASIIKVAVAYMYRDI